MQELVPISTSQTEPFQQSDGLLKFLHRWSDQVCQTLVFIKSVRKQPMDHPTNREEVEDAIQAKFYLSPEIKTDLAISHLKPGSVRRSTSGGYVKAIHKVRQKGSIQSQPNQIHIQVL